MNKNCNKLEAGINCKRQLTPDPRVNFKVNAGGVLIKKIPYLFPVRDFQEKQYGNI